MSENLQYLYGSQFSKLSNSPSEKDAEFQLSNNSSVIDCIDKQKNPEKDEYLNRDQNFLEEEADIDFKDLYTLYRIFF